MNTLRLRAAAIGDMHRLAGLTSGTQSAAVIQTLRGYQRGSTEAPRRKLALRVELLRDVIQLIPVDELTGLRDRAILLLGFAGALRRSELAALDARAVEIICTPQRYGLRIHLPRSKGDRAGMARLWSSRPAACSTELCRFAAYRA